MAQALKRKEAGGSGGHGIEVSGMRARGNEMNGLNRKDATTAEPLFLNNFHYAAGAAGICHPDKVNSLWQRIKVINLNPASVIGIKQLLTHFPSAYISDRDSEAFLICRAGYGNINCSGEWVGPNLVNGNGAIALR